MPLGIIILAIFSILAGFVQVVVGFGLFTLQSWAYWLAWIGAVIFLVNPVVGLFSGNVWALFGLIIPGIIFFYLTFDDDIKRAFRRG